MSLFSKLGKVFGRDSAPEAAAMKELETLNKDGRLHARYLISGEGVARIELENGMAGIVKDVSYGGMAVKFELKDATTPTKIPDPLRARLHLLDRSIECVMALVRSVHPPGQQTLYAGFAIRHESADTLIFMRDLIEPLRCGKSLTALDQSMRHERYKSAEWSCLRGDGPTDLIIRLTKDSLSLQEALLTFRISDSYCEVSFQNNTLRTGRMVGIGNSKMTVGSQMASTTDVDLTVLRQSICILLGAPPASRRLVAPLLKESLRHLKIDYQETAA